MSNLLITNASIITPEQNLPSGYLLVKNGIINQIGNTANLPSDTTKEYQCVDAGGNTVIPGLIDSHTHGAVGFDTMQKNLSEQNISDLLLWAASTGMTGIIPTIGSCPLDEQKDIIRKLVRVAESGSPGTKILGIHLEGPYLNPEMRGAQPEAALRVPNLTEMQETLAAGQGWIRMVTLAPELDGSLDLIRYLAKNNIAIGIGHSKADGITTIKAIEAGANRSVHLYNAMSGLHHRNLGVVGATLSHPQIFAELILDGHHIHPAAAVIAHRAKGTQRILLVTDSTQATGLNDGEYIRPGNRKVIVKNGKVQFQDGTLAGSILTIDKAVCNAMKFLDITLSEAVSMASTNVAANLNLSTKGSIEVGKDADLVFVDQDFNIKQTYVQGKPVFSDINDENQSQQN